VPPTAVSFQSTCQPHQCSGHADQSCTCLDVGLPRRGTDLTEAKGEKINTLLTEDETEYIMPPTFRFHRTTAPGAGEPSVRGAPSRELWSKVAETGGLG